MRFLFQILGIVLLAKLSSQSCSFPPPQWCISTSDPMIEPFDQGPQKVIYNFNAEVSNTLFYSDNRNDDNVITGSFLKCNLGCPLTCNCGFHFRSRDTTLFIDACGLSDTVDTSITNLATQFFASYPSQALEQVDCTKKTVPSSKVTDDNWWKTAGNAINVNNQLLCARVAGGKSIVIRTNYQTDVLNVYARILPAEKAGLAQVKIRAAAHAFKHTKGLCGRWNNDLSDDDPKLSLVNGEFLFQSDGTPIDENAVNAAFQSALGVDREYCCDEDCEKSEIQCAVEYYLGNIDADFNAAALSSEDAVERTEEERAAFCNSLIKSEDVTNLYDLVGVSQDGLDFMLEFCLEVIGTGINDVGLAQLRLIVVEEVLPIYCENIAQNDVRSEEHT